MEKAKVYFTKEITPESVVKIFEKLGKDLPGKVAIAKIMNERLNLKND